LNDLKDILALTISNNEQINFNTVFNKLECDFSLDLPNENSLEVFHLKKGNKKFEYKQLESYCVANLSQYVFNRKRAKGAKDMADFQMLFHEARAKFRQINSEKDTGAGGELGEILLYLFLENRLKAPKLLSKMELKTSNNQYIHGADGVFLYQTEDKYGVPIYQFILGEAKIKNDILDAARVAFDSLENTIKNSDVEEGLVSLEIFNEVCSKEDAEAIEAMILPKDDISEESIIHEKAIGVFIGYSVDYENDNISNSEWNRNVDSKIENDIKRAVSTIKKRITKTKLSGYSFYCYFLPLNTADDDRVSIMNSII
jgi:hypothetical protein